MKLTFECKTKQEKKAAEEFLNWLSNSGEQQYWEAVEDRQFEANMDDEGDITIVKFNYDFKKMEVELSLGDHGRAGHRR